jgi:hypothetical protein
LWHTWCISPSTHTTQSSCLPPLPGHRGLYTPHCRWQTLKVGRPETKILWLDWDWTTDNFLAVDFWDSLSLIESFFSLAHSVVWIFSVSILWCTYLGHPFDVHAQMHWCTKCLIRQFLWVWQLTNEFVSILSLSLSFDSLFMLRICLKYYKFRRWYFLVCSSLKAQKLKFKIILLQKVVSELY